MTFNYEPNFHIHSVNESHTISTLPTKLPNGKYKFRIAKPLKGVLIDTSGRIHCYKGLKIGDYILTILLVSNGSVIAETNFIIFVRDPEQESSYEPDENKGKNQGEK